MRLKKKPGPKPERRLIEVTIGIEINNVQQLLDEAKKFGITNPKDIEVRFIWDDTEFVIKTLEDNIVYDEKVSMWEKANQEYKEWYEKNKEAIEEEIAAREEKKLLAKLEKKKGLTDKINKLKKELGEM